MDYDDYLDEQLFGDDDIINTESVVGEAPSSVKNAGSGDEDVLKSVWETTEDTTQKKQPLAVKPRPKLTERELVSPKGLPALVSLFQNYEPSDKLNPYENVNAILNKMEYWAHRLFPQLRFDDFLEKVEIIGRKRLVSASLQKLRLGMSLQDDDAVAAEDEENKEKEKTAEELFDEQFVDDFYNDDDFPVENLNIANNEPKQTENEKKNGSDSEVDDDEFESQLRNIFGKREKTPVAPDSPNSPEGMPVKRRKAIVASDSEDEAADSEMPPENLEGVRKGRLNTELWSDED